MAVPEALDHETAATLCRSGAYRTCRRYQDAEAREGRGNVKSPEPSIARKLLTSALWVIGIPTAITLAILIAAWVTEKIWVQTDQVIAQITGMLWF